MARILSLEAAFYLHKWRMLNSRQLRRGAGADGGAVMDASRCSSFTEVTKNFNLWTLHGGKQRETMLETLHFPMS